MKITTTKPFKPLPSNPKPIIIQCHICNIHQARWTLIIDKVFRVLSCDNCRTVDVDGIMKLI